MRFVTAHLRVRVLAVLISIATAIGVLAHQDTAAGVLSGQVVDDSGQGLAGATVKIALIGGPTKIERTTTAGDGGRFEFRDVPVGRFALVASFADYLSTQFGAERPDAPGVPVRIAAGQRLSNVVVTLRRAGAISGRLTNDRGEPCAGRVRVIAKQKIPGVFLNVGEDGTYRIGDLADGSYLIVAEARDREVHITDKSGADRTAVLARTFYPGVTSETDAAPVTIGPGDSLTGMDIRLKAQPATSVEVTVTTPAGLRPQQVVLALLASDGTTTSIQPYTSGDELPRIDDVVAGQYQLIVAGVDNPQGPRETEWATGLVTIDHVDGSGPVRVSLVLQSGAHLQGTAQLDPMAVPSGFDGRHVLDKFLGRDGGTRVVMIGDGTSPARGPSFDRVVPAWLTPIGPAARRGVIPIDGRFEMFADAARFGITDIAPGRYVIQAGDVDGPPGWSLKSATIGGHDVLDLPIALRYGDKLNDVALTLTNRYATLTGAVTDDTLKRRFDATVVVFPSDARRRWPGSKRIRTTRPDTSGVYEFRDLPAGDYSIATVPAQSPHDWTDLDQLDTLARTAVSVTVGDGEQKVQDLRMPMVTSPVHADYRRQGHRLQPGA